MRGGTGARAGQAPQRGEGLVEEGGQALGVGRRADHPGAQRGDREAAEPGEDRAEREQCQAVEQAELVQLEQVEDPRQREQGDQEEEPGQGEVGELEQGAAAAGELHDLPRFRAMRELGERAPG